MMPFAAEFNGVYEAIKAACRTRRIEARRVDEIYKPTKIIDDVFATIAQSRLVICDLTGRNANVLYESGLAHALDCDVILVTQTIEERPFRPAAIPRYQVPAETRKVCRSWRRTLNKRFRRPFKRPPRRGLTGSKPYGRHGMRIQRQSLFFCRACSRVGILCSSSSQS